MCAYSFQAEKQINHTLKWDVLCDGKKIDNA